MNSGVIDFSEMASGLTILCGGDRQTKVEAAFNLLDYDASGYIEVACR